MHKYMMAIGAFAAGGALGFFAADKLMKQKYEQQVQEDVESVKAAFKRSSKPAAPQEAAASEAEASSPAAKEDAPKTYEKALENTEKMRAEYQQKISNMGYTDEKKPKPAYKPRVISPEEFGDMDEYEQIELTYYVDGTVADDDDRAMSQAEIDETIGMESLNHFGEYEEDSLFVRNDRLKVDYEVLMDARSYEDILQEKPYLRHLKN